MDFLEVLREECGIVSAKNGCAPEGTCGCCTVLVDGRPVMSCLRKPEQMEGHAVTTLEGHRAGNAPRALTEAFVLEGGVQCGFCIPGILVRACVDVEAGLHGRPRGGREGAFRASLPLHGLSRILDGIQTAGEAWNDDKQLPRSEPRHHSYFGEEYGLQRNPEFAKTLNNGIGQSPSRYRGIEQAAGERPFIDDMKMPGMLHGAPVMTAHPRAKILAIDTSIAEDMPGVGENFYSGGCSGRARDRHHDVGFAGVCGCGRDDVLHRRRAGVCRSGYDVPRAGSGEESHRRLRSAGRR